MKQKACESVVKGRTFQNFRVKILAAITTALFVGAGTPAAEVGAGSAPALAAGSSTNEAPAGATDPGASGKGLRFNFKNSPLDTVMTYLSREAGFVIHPEVSLNGRVTAWSDQPLSDEEALTLLEHVLSEQGYSVVRDDRLLTIFSSSDARHRAIPVIKFTRVEDIPRNSEVATYIIPIRTLNPIALLNNLRTLINPSADLQANESANSLLITDTKSDIRHLAEIITQLDSVSASINSVEVMPLKYADAKALVDIVKQVFPSQDTSRNSPQVGGFFGGGIAGGLMGMPGGTASSGSSTSAGTHVTAVADDHSNSLVVSAPEDLLPTIRQLVQRLDQPVDDVTEVRVFQLKNADCTEMANLLATLFPATSSSDASQSPFMLGGLGGGVMGFPGAAATSTGSTGASQYVKKMADVLAVPDARTRALVVSASKDMMPQIEAMVSELDTIDRGKQVVHRIALNNAEPADLLQIVQDLFPAGTTTTSTRQNTTQNNALSQRAQTMNQNMLSSGPGSGSASSSKSSGGTSGTVATGF